MGNVAAGAMACVKPAGSHLADYRQTEKGVETWNGWHTLS